MKCEKCNTDMIKFEEGSTQGIVCIRCGWNIVSTRISEVYMDMMDYGIYIRTTADINKEKIKLIAKIAGVNYVNAKQILTKDDVCILKAKAPQVKKVIDELEKFNIKYEIKPMFKY